MSFFLLYSTLLNTLPFSCPAGRRTDNNIHIIMATNTTCTTCINVLSDQIRRWWWRYDANDVTVERSETVCVCVCVWYDELINHHYTIYYIIWYSGPVGRCLRRDNAVLAKLGYCYWLSNGTKWSEAVFVVFVTAVHYFIIHITFIK